ncbi:MAG: hypothetical protein ACRD2X_18380 [Vicinamibacteraceae bacterium]
MTIGRRWPGNAVLSVLLATAGMSGVALGQEPPAIEVGPAPPRDCREGVIYDDGTAENGYSGDPNVVSGYEVQQLVNPDRLTVVPTTMCVQLTRNAEAGNLDFDIVAYDGTPEGGPTTELGSISVSARGIPRFPHALWFEIDITALAPKGGTPMVFLGVRWNPMQFPGRFIAADESHGTARHPSFERFLPTFGQWDGMTEHANYRALMIRAKLDDGAPPPPIALSADGRWTQGFHVVDLSWDGATSPQVDILRNGEIVATVPNDGLHTYSTERRGRAVYAFQVCEAGTAICSNETTVRFGGATGTRSRE